MQSVVPGYQMIDSSMIRPRGSKSAVQKELPKPNESSVRLDELSKEIQRKGKDIKRQKLRFSCITS